MASFSGGSSQLSWILDPDSRKWFWYDPNSDTYNYEDQRRARRPADVPRSALRSNEDFQAHWRSTHQQSLSSYGSSPNDGSNYTYSRPTPSEGQSSRSTDKNPTGQSNRPNTSHSSYRPAASNDLTAPMGGLSLTQQNQYADSQQQQRLPPQYRRDSVQSSSGSVRSGVPTSTQTLQNTPQQHSVRQLPGSQQSIGQPRQSAQPQVISQQPGLSAVQRNQLSQQQPLNPTLSQATPRPSPAQPQQVQRPTAPARASDDPQHAGAQPSPAGTHSSSRQQYLDPVVPHVSENGRVVDVRHPANGVRTLYRTAPPEAITDASLYRIGVRAHRLLIGTGTGLEGETERLFASFKVRDKPQKFFTVGKVFLVLWVEPAGESRTAVTSVQPGTTKGRYGERVFSKVRRFVVIRDAGTYCSALPIATYGQQGVGKPGVNKSEHGIVHTGRNAPQPLDQELSSRVETAMRPYAIRVDPDAPDDKLDPLSRIDYGKVHTIQHNVKVKSFGKVNAKSEPALLSQFMTVWSSASRQAVPTENNVASSSRGNQDTGAPAAVQRQSVGGSSRDRGTPTAPSSGSRSSRGRGNVSQPDAIAEEQGEEDDEEEAGDSEPEDDRDQASNSAAVHAYNVAIRDLVRQGYTEQQAIQFLRQRIARQRGQ